MYMCMNICAYVYAYKRITHLSRGGINITQLMDVPLSRRCQRRSLKLRIYKPKKYYPNLAVAKDALQPG